MARWAQSHIIMEEDTTYRQNIWSKSTWWYGGETSAVKIFCCDLIMLPLLHAKYIASLGPKHWPSQGGITCGVIDEPRKSSKPIDERVIINFRDKNVVIAHFRDKNVYR